MATRVTDREKRALRLFAAQQGRQWRACLRQMWETGNYWGTATDATVLQGLRNRIGFGPTGLAAFRI